MKIIKFIVVCFSILLFSCTLYSCFSKNKLDSKNTTKILFQNDTLNKYTIILINPSDCNICEEKIINKISSKDFNIGLTKAVIIQPNNRYIFKKNWAKINLITNNNIRVYFNDFLFNYYSKLKPVNDFRNSIIILDQNEKLINYINFE